MFFKKFDYLSPPITLFFKEENQHSSIFSGILSCIAYVLVFIAGIYYTLDFINKGSPKAYFFNRYIQDAGTFPVNASSIFNFIQITDTKTNEAIPFDFSVFRAVGVDEIFYEEYMNNPNIILNSSHWLYGNCNNNTDTEGIGYLIDFSYYEQSACIRKYYDKDRKKYYNTGEEGFKWPVIEKGCSNPDRTYYGIIMQRCDKAPDILKEQDKECKTEAEITETIGKVSLKFQLIDHYADMLNYEMPFTKYFYEVTSAITNGVFIINHLNFNPANMLTHNGIFFDNQVQERSYFFTQNEKHTINESTNLSQGQPINGCLIGIYFWMQNTLQYYERNYDRLQDVLSDIGGISSIVVTSAYLINLLVNNYIILLDTQEFVLNTDQNNFIKRRNMKRPTIFRKANEIMFPPRRVYVNQGGRNKYKDESQDQSSNYQKLMKDGVDIYQNNIFGKDEKNDNYTNIYLKRNNILNNNYQKKNNKKRSSLRASQKTKIYSDNYMRMNFNERSSNFNKEVNFVIPKVNKNESNENDKNKDNDSSSNENKQINKQNFNWFKYLLYLITWGRSDVKIAYYETFRAKLISEENIIQNYLDIYKLLKINNLPTKDLFKKES